MIRGVLLSVLLGGAALAQNVLVPTRPAGDNTNAAASTAFVQTAIPLAAITSLTGPITAVGPGAAATTIGAGVVTGSNIASGTVANSNLANTAAGTIKGNCTNATAAPQDCSNLIPVIPDDICATVDRAGATDMGACINSTITAAQPATCGTAGNATVKLRAGTYLITTTTVPKSCVTIEGDGTGKTVFLVNTTSPIAQASGNQLVHWKLKGVTLKDNGTHANSVTFATVNAGGSGFGATATGTMTWSGAGCSTNPVLNVTTNAGGNIVTVNSVTTAGSCTTFPSNTATTWTAGGALSAGTAASFNLQSALVGMAFTSLQGSIIEDVEFANWQSGTLYSVNGAANSTFSDTNGIWNSSNTFFNSIYHVFAPNGCARCFVEAGAYGGTPTASPPNSSNQPSIVVTQNEFDDINLFGVSIYAFDEVKASDTHYVRKAVVWMNSNTAVAIQAGDDNANFPGNNYVNGIRAQISVSLLSPATSTTILRAGDWTFNHTLDLETDIAPSAITLTAAQPNVTLFKVDICGRNPINGFLDASGFNTNKLCISGNFGSSNDGQGTFYRYNNGSASLPIVGFTNDSGNGIFLPAAGVFGITKALSVGNPTGGGALGTINAATAAASYQVNGTTVADNSAWSAFTPSLTCTGGTWTPSSARSKTLGKTTFIEIDATLGAAACTGATTFTLPNTSNSSGSANGQEVVNTNAAVACRISGATTTATCVANGGSNFAANSRIIASGVYENQ